MRSTETPRTVFALQIRYEKYKELNVLAIPVDTESFGVTSSLLFGNAPMFALYNNDEKQFVFKKNPGCGNGFETAKALKSWDVTQVVYSFLGDGPFNAMNKYGIEIFHIGKETLGVSEIVKGIEDNLYIRVDTNNADIYLDPGTAAGNCECGCSHE